MVCTVFFLQKIGAHAKQKGSQGSWRVASRPSQLSSIKAELAAAQNAFNAVSFPELVQLTSKSLNSQKRKIVTLEPEEGIH